MVLTAAADTQTMYLDGNPVGTKAAQLVATGASYATVGASVFGSYWPDNSYGDNVVGYFKGSIAEVAYYRTQLGQVDVKAQYQARLQSSGTPTKTVVVTDPAGGQFTHVYDVFTARKVAEVDALNNKTQFGYDTGGSLRTVIDPNGNVTTTEQDVRGNTISSKTCQNRQASLCSTIFYTYYPDSTNPNPPPDVRNDVLMTVRDGRSASALDNTYKTTFGYDALGNRTSVTDPLGRVTATAYTDGMRRRTRTEM